MNAETYRLNNGMVFWVVVVVQDRRSRCDFHAVAQSELELEFATAGARREVKDNVVGVNFITQDGRGASQNRPLLLREIYD